MYMKGGKQNVARLDQFGIYIFPLYNGNAWECFELTQLNMFMTLHAELHMKLNSEEA